MLWGWRSCGGGGWDPGGRDRVQAQQQRPPWLLLPLLPVSTERQGAPEAHSWAEAATVTQRILEQSCLRLPCASFLQPRPRREARRAARHALTLNDGAVLGGGEDGRVVRGDDHAGDGELVAPEDSNVARGWGLDLAGRSVSQRLGQEAPHLHACTHARTRVHTLPAQKETRPRLRAHHVPRKDPAA